MKQFSNHYYTIAQVSAITGISKETIRKWEERHQIVEPLRLDNGYRAYTQPQVDILLAIQQYIREGMSIRQAIAALKQPVEEEFAPSPTSSVSSFYTKLLEAGDRCDTDDMKRILFEAHQHLTLHEFLEQLIVPFLKETGDRWASKQWSEYHEKLVSSTIQHDLIQIYENYPKQQQKPFVLGACLPDEHHELPLHILLLQLALFGYPTFLIGSSPAPGTIEALIERMQPDIVLLSAATTIPLQNKQSLKQLDEFAKRHPETRFFIGGDGVFCNEVPLALKHITPLLHARSIWQYLQ